MQKNGYYLWWQATNKTGIPAEWHVCCCCGELRGAICWMPNEECFILQLHLECIDIVGVVGAFYERWWMRTWKMLELFKCSRFHAYLYLRFVLVVWKLASGWQRHVIISFNRYYTRTFQFSRLKRLREVRIFFVWEALYQQTACFICPVFKP